MAQVKTSISATIRSLPDGKNVQVEIKHFGGSDLVPGLMLARFAAADSPNALQALRSRSDVLYAEPNYIRRASVVPDDTRYQDLWALKNSAPDGPGVSAESAWDTTTGSHSIVVGVIDTGVDIDHRDLRDNIFINPGEVPGNGVDDDSNGFIDDVNGWDFFHHDRTVFDSASDDAHGTHVAGSLGARGNNSVGVVGVNWNVQLLPIKALGPVGASDAVLLEAFNYAKLMRQRGVNLRVLNNSYGGQGFSASLGLGIKELNDAGILFVAAAGNESLNNDFVPVYPASYDLPNVISVAASSDQNLLADSFSNRGQQSVHLVAPGRGILSTTPRGYSGAGIVGAYTEPDGSTYSIFSGTSMASPHVAGAAALACAANQNISMEKLRAAVLFSVDQSGNYISTVITGGRLNANKAVQAALENDVTAPAAAGNFHINSQNGRRVELKWNEAGDDGSSGRASLDEISFVDGATSERFLLNSTRSQDPGTERTVFVSIPYKHATGQLFLRTFDNVGNVSSTAASVSVGAAATDPYIVTIDPAEPLTPVNSDNIVGPKGDDVTSLVGLPFDFTFFGFTLSHVVVSSNGAIYVPIPPDFAVPHPNNVGSDDGAIATTSNLEGLAMIAGMWTDLRTDRNPTGNVYMVQPDRDRVIFRWQAVTFGSETPANFEIELRRNGTIKTRYGIGNQNLTPIVVGISGGDREAYIVQTHTSEIAPLSLNQAQGVTFALRNPPPPPSSDLMTTMSFSPELVVPGQNLTYAVRIKNLGPEETEDLVMTDVLPPGTTFVSCTTSHFTTAACSGPPVGTNGTVTGTSDPLQPSPSNSGLDFTIVVKVTAAAGTVLHNTASATTSRSDPNPADNSATVTTNVVAESFFNGVRKISAGHSHTSSVRNDGTVWNWGTGSLGQLGNGNSGVGVSAVTPIQVNGLEGFSDVADGNGCVLALKSDGTVWGWGLNNNGQLGDGTTIDRTRPVQTSGLTNVVGISLGDFYGAAVKSDGTVWVWGEVSSLGIPPFPNVKTTPSQLAGIANVTAISAGANHLLMLKADKTVWGVGANSYGQLGDGTTTGRQVPVQVSSLTNVAQIAGSVDFSFARKEDGTVWGWGSHYNGQLGPGAGSTNLNPHPLPILNTGLPAGVADISAGSGFCLAVAANGTVWSWGDNSNAQLGQGPQINQNPVPSQIPNLTNVSKVSGGTYHSAALKTDGSVWAWGANVEGEVGDGTVTRRPAPINVSGLQAVSSPSFNPPGGTFTNAVNVTITCATPGAIIHFTTNGNEPTESDPVFAPGSVLQLSAFTFLRARAWKAGLLSSSTSFAQYDINAPTLPLQLLIDETGPAANQAAAMDSMLLLRDPFPVVNGANLYNRGTDLNTRVILFVTNLQLATGEPASFVVVTLIDANGHAHNIPAEDVRSVPNSSFTQVVFRLPTGLPAGTAQVKINAHSLVSNFGSIRIRN